MRIIALIVIAAVIAAGCAQQPPVENKSQPECSADADCGTGGCSGQVCGKASEAAGIITTCEYMEEYACHALTSCGCVQGKCIWRNNSDYQKCMTEAQE